MGTEKEETTLDLDQAMVDGMDKFQGELVEAAREEGAERIAESAEQKKRPLPRNPMIRTALRKRKRMRRELRTKKRRRMEEKGRGCGGNSGQREDAG